MLLKMGVALMVFALAFAGVVAVIAFLDELMQRVSATRPAAEPSVKPLHRSNLPPKPEVKNAEVQPTPKPEPEPAREVPTVATADWPMPTNQEIEAASEPRHYDLPRGAVMGLTINALGLHNVPVFDSNGRWALDNGVAHLPGTSFPWSNIPQRNVYIAGHRLGWRGTESHLVFYDLDKLSRGDKILLENRDGQKFWYRVTEAFVTDPGDSWVMGQVRGRDMVTLQTCTPIPAFDKRLIVRADRI
jgi:sortase A